MRRLPLPIRWLAPVYHVQAEWSWAAMAESAQAPESGLEDFVSVVVYDYNLQRRLTAIQT
jgi:hypothetical protein